MRQDEELLLPLVRAALGAARAHAPLQLLASPWSPPAWMKSNGAMDGNGAPQGLRAEASSSWAAYLSRWLSAWSRKGVNVSLLTVQNEPMAPSPWEACFYDAAQVVTSPAASPAVSPAASSAASPRRILSISIAISIALLITCALLPSSSAFLTAALPCRPSSPPLACSGSRVHRFSSRPGAQGRRSTWSPPAGQPAPCHAPGAIPRSDSQKRFPEAIPRCRPFAPDAVRASQVRLLGHDDQKDTIGEWSEALLGEGAAAAEFTAGIAYHWCAHLPLTFH